MCAFKYKIIFCYTDNEMSQSCVPPSVSMELDINNAYDLSSHQIPCHYELSVKDMHVRANKFTLYPSYDQEYIIEEGECSTPLCYNSC